MTRSDPTRPGIPRRHVLALGLAAVMFSGAGAALAQDYPAKTITFMVPFGAGGNGDIVARMMAEGMGAKLGQTVVVENLPGAGGLIGAAKVKQAKPDGYTIMLSNNSMTVTAALNPDSPVSIDKDFTHVSQLTSSYSVLVAPGNSRFDTLAQIIAAAKEKPGELIYASTGVGSGAHLQTALIAYLAGLDMVHVPYDGAPQATTDLIAGRADLLWLNVATAMPLINSGQIKGIAVAAPTKLKATGDIPPVADTLPGFEYNNWLAVSAPAGLPAPVTARLNAVIAEVLAEPKYHDRLLDLGQFPTPSTPEEITATAAALGQKWVEVAKETGLEMQ